jgi:ribosomal-protein-alanine N-acetyltransferase
MWFAADSPRSGKLTIRWACRADLATLAALEQAAYGSAALALQHLEEALQERGRAALLAESDRVVGYLLYYLDVPRRQVRILRLAVAPDQRRQGIGTELLQKLWHRLHSLAGLRTTLLLHEGNLAGQLFAKARGFRANRIYRRFFEDADGYLFEHQLPKN